MTDKSAYSGNYTHTMREIDFSIDILLGSIIKCQYIMDKSHLKDILLAVKSKKIGIESALEKLRHFPYEEMGFAKIDHHRKIRKGFSEIIYCEGKTPEQVSDIFLHMSKNSDWILGTKATDTIYKQARKALPELIFHQVPKIIEYSRKAKKKVGKVVIATGGTSDIPIAEEAAVILEVLGNKVEKLYDVGVAGIHRLFANIKAFDKANAIIAVAGMEGALPSVMAGLVNVPIIAVPTSVGYGTSFGGVTALLSMLNSCAPGVSVVNIDNGFGAACQADMINKSAVH